MVGADAEVVHASGAAEADLAAVVDVVVAQSVMGRGAGAAGRAGFREGLVGGGWGAAVEGAVWALVVVDLAEAVQLFLQGGDGFGRGLVG